MSSVCGVSPATIQPAGNRFPSTSRVLVLSPEAWSFSARASQSSRGETRHDRVQDLFCSSDQALSSWVTRIASVSHASNPTARGPTPQASEKVAVQLTDIVLVRFVESPFHCRLQSLMVRCVAKPGPGTRTAFDVRNGHSLRTVRRRLYAPGRCSSAG